MARSLTVPLPNHRPLDFGTKTSYRPPNPLPTMPYALDQGNKGKGTNSPTAPRLIHVSLVARHGTRNPTNNSISRMTALEQWLQKSLPHTPSWLAEYSEYLKEYRRNPGALTSHGQQELHCIGFRFATLYALNLQHVGANLRIRASYKERAVSSARAFCQGYIAACDSLHLPHRITSADPHLLRIPTEEEQAPSSPAPPTSPVIPFSPAQSQSHLIPTEQPLQCESDSSLPSLASASDTDSVSDPDTPPSESPMCSVDGLDHLPVEVLPHGRDDILRFFERNEAYANFAYQHKAHTLKDLSRGSLRRHTADMARRMTEAFKSPVELDIDLVRAVAEAAAFDTAHGRAATSMFCNTLTMADVRVLDTFERRHRPFFKAHERFRNASAPLVQDLADSIHASIENANPKNGRKNSAYAADLRFAHAETLIPLLLLLEIKSNGLSPSHPDYRKGLAGMSPFAANFALELYEADQEDGAKHHFVRFRLNERYVERVPALREHGKTGVVQLKHLLDFFNKVLEAEK